MTCENLIPELPTYSLCAWWARPSGTERSKDGSRQGGVSVPTASRTELPGPKSARIRPFMFKRELTAYSYPCWLSTSEKFIQDKTIGSIFSYICAKNTQLYWLQAYIFVTSSPSKKSSKPSSKDNFWLHEPQGLKGFRREMARVVVFSEAMVKPRHSKMVTCSSISLGTFQDKTDKKTAAANFRLFLYENCRKLFFQILP